MAEVVVRVRPNGPYVIEGPVQVLDAQGNPYPVPPDKPFCDGAHRTCQFSAP